MIDIQWCERYLGRRFRSIICLDGDLPSAGFFKQGLPIVAADGAANLLNQIGVEPQLIVGDLDSVEPSLLQRFPYLKQTDQSTTDFQKVLACLPERHYDPAIVVGVSGGALDHILNNINVLMETACVLYAPPIWGFVLSVPEKTSFELPLETKISIMGLPEAEVSSEGLKWELERHCLQFPGLNSCLNRTSSGQVSLNLHSGKLLVLIYERPIQDAGHFAQGKS